MNCPSSLDKTGKEGLSGITCPVACQSRVAPEEIRCQFIPEEIRKKSGVSSSHVPHIFHK